MERLVQTVEASPSDDRLGARKAGFAPRTKPPSHQRPKEKRVRHTKINSFLGGLRVVAIRKQAGSTSTTSHRTLMWPRRTANTVVQQFTSKTSSLRFLASKEVTEWLNETTGEQRKALDASVEALRAYQRKNWIMPVGEQPA